MKKTMTFAVALAGFGLMLLMPFPQSGHAEDPHGSNTGGNTQNGNSRFRLGQPVQLPDGSTFVPEKWWGTPGKVAIGSFSGPPYGSVPMTRGADYNNWKVTGPVLLDKGLTPRGMKQVWYHEKDHLDLPRDTQLNPGIDSMARTRLSPSFYNSWRLSQGMTSDQAEFRAYKNEMTTPDFRDWRRVPSKEPFSKTQTWGQYRAGTAANVASYGEQAYKQATGKNYPNGAYHYDVEKNTIVADHGRPATECVTGEFRVSGWP